MLRKHLWGFVLSSLMGLAPLPARAGIPVIDVTAIANLLQQVGYWQQQIQSMVRQYDQLQQTFGAMTGGRGMEMLLPTTSLARNYLPPDYAGLISALDGSSATYSGLSGQVQSVMAANAVLSNAQLGTLSPDMRQIVESGRRAAAMLNATTQNAYSNTSQRFAALQQLIDHVGAAPDIKAIQDLQGRIGAEQSMLTNEQTKLQSLYQMAQADELAQRQKVREQIISGHGAFSSRFIPSP